MPSVSARLCLFRSALQHAETRGRTRLHRHSFPGKHTANRDAGAPLAYSVGPHVRVIFGIDVESLRHTNGTEVL